MTHDVWLWLCLGAYTLHILEEYAFDWKNWAERVLKLPVGWDNFALVNGAVVVLGIASAEIGWRWPEVSLSLPALMVINATLFHVLPFVVTRGRFSPGLATAVVLFYPTAWFTYRGAALDGVLSTSVVVISFVIGALLMASPIVLLKLRSKPYFRQDR